MHLKDYLPMRRAGEEIICHLDITADGTVGIAIQYPLDTGLEPF